MIYPWHQSAWNKLVQSHRTGRLAHGLLLHGNRGTGKHDFAKAFASWLICEQNQDNDEEDFKAFLQTIAFNSPQSAVVFNVTADTEFDPDEIRSVMSRQLCSPVKWYDAMKKLVEEEIEIFVEIGPGKVLTGLLRKNLPKDYPATVLTVNDLNTFENFIKKTA